MNVIKQYNQINYNTPRGIALGNFDGVHIGHQKLIHQLLEKCQSNNLETCVYTFSNHTIPTISNGESIQYITNLYIKKKIFSDLGVDTLFLDSFNEILMALNPEDFVKTILVETLNCKIAVIGFDYRFGHKAEGDAFLLKQLGEKYGFEVIVIDAVTMYGEKVSSSHIRNYLKNGDLDRVNKYLGRSFSIYNQVIDGDAKKKKLGYQTANILLEPLQIIPKPGVYATLIKIQNKTYKGLTLINTTSTFDSKSPFVETFIMDYDGDLGNQFIEVQFIKRLRDEIRFEDPQSLENQISKDIMQIKKHLQYN
ncbi:bifunctional riboflavin kinase/FAD synthetase [Natronincola ferrireducens]|uniref:Riboflavin biosynthesis protein n=1 Tax=Natronincola ferrireducens TaxID=393762 RepID=A0A1G9C6A6_9FIRM|nr:bifunctional riboflavin kinase/FAD synthetase [Natronincola ferrireducens]SDK47218.1 riboflavin kinase / FMN adenylyltransferase [Natronincola ferrireducens]